MGETWRGNSPVSVKKKFHKMQQNIASCMKIIMQSKTSEFKKKERKIYYEKHVFARAFLQVFPFRQKLVEPVNIYGILL